MAQEMRSGTYTGNAAAINIELGFTPDYVKIVNITDGDDAWEWFSNMPNASAIYYKGIVDNGATAAAALSKITANGVSPYAGGPANAKGFTVGTALSENAKVFSYLAFRNAEY